MVVNTSKIVGYVVIPNDTVREKSSIIFRMTGFDTDDDDSATVVPFPIDAPIADDGSIDVDLWPNPEGVRATFYSVTASLYNGIRPVLVDLGKISVPVAGGPFDLNDLLPVVPPQGADVDDYIAYLAAAVAGAEAAATDADTSATNAATSAAEAALFDGPRFETIPLMAASNIPTDGEYVNVDNAFNNEPETFRYDASSTLTADGSLIVMPASGVGRYVSTRTVYADWAEAKGDVRTFTPQTVLTIRGITGTLTARADAGSWGQTNSGGQNFDAWSITGDATLWGLGSGQVTDSIAIQYAWDAGDYVKLPAGVYDVRGIAIDGGAESSGGKTLDASAAELRNDAADGTSMFVIGENSVVNFLKIKAKRIHVSAGGGHVFDLRGTLNHSEIDVDYIRQQETSKSIIYHDDTSYFFNKVRGLFWAISTAHTVPALRFSTTSNKISGNEFDILRPDRSGSVHFMEVLSTSLSDYNYSNKIALRNPEVCRGGVLKLARAFNTIVDQMNCFDMGAVTNHIIEVGTPGFLCQNTKILGYQRNSGTLGAGIRDIFLGDANFTYIEAPSGISTATMIDIDVNNEPNTTILSPAHCNIYNQLDTSTVELSTTDGLVAPKLTLTPQSDSLQISGGAITVTDSIHNIDTEALAATDDLETINGGRDGQILILRSVSNARDVTLQDGAGNMYLAGDFTLTRDRDTITLRYDGSLSAWVELSRSDNAV